MSIPKKIVAVAGKVTAIKKECTMICSCLTEFKSYCSGPDISTEITVLAIIVVCTKEAS